MNKGAEASNHRSRSTIKTQRTCLFGNAAQCRYGNDKTTTRRKNAGGFPVHWRDRSRTKTSRHVLCGCGCGRSAHCTHLRWVHTTSPWMPPHCICIAAHLLKFMSSSEESDMKARPPPVAHPCRDLDTASEFAAGISRCTPRSQRRSSLMGIHGCVIRLRGVN